MLLTLHIQMEIQCYHKSLSFSPSFSCNINSFLQHEVAGKPLYLSHLNLKGIFFFVKLVMIGEACFSLSLKIKVGRKRRRRGWRKIIGCSTNDYIQNFMDKLRSIKTRERSLQISETSSNNIK